MIVGALKLLNTAVALLRVATLVACAGAAVAVSVVLPALIGVNIGRLWGLSDLLTSELRAILDGVAQGAFRPIVDLEVPFAEAPRAHQRLEQRENFGKVVLVP